MLFDMGKINIIVCLKQVPDPEGPPSAFEIIPEKRKVIPRGIPPVINPDDENALEAALRIKDIHESKTTAISMGRNLSKAVLGKSLAVGADELVFLQDDAFEDLDSYPTAFILSVAIKKLGRYDLILTGRQSADWGNAQVGYGIAETLGIPCVSIARKIELANGKVRVERMLPNGYQVIEVPLPVVVTVTSALGDLRRATLPDIMAARKKPVAIWNAEDLGVNPSELRRTKLLRLFAPVREVACQLVEGETPQEAGANLAVKLREAKII